MYAARRTPHPGLDLLIEEQQDRLEKLFVAYEQIEVEATWGVYQRLVAAYRKSDRIKGRTDGHTDLLGRL